MNKTIEKNSYLFIFGAHQNLPIHRVFKLEHYQGLKDYWGFK